MADPVLVADVDQTVVPVVVKDAQGNAVFTAGTKFLADFTLTLHGTAIGVDLTLSTVTCQLVDSVSGKDVLAIPKTLAVIDNSAKIVRLELTPAETALLGGRTVLGDVKVIPPSGADDESSHGPFQIAYRKPYTP